MTLVPHSLSLTSSRRGRSCAASTLPRPLIYGSFGAAAGTMSTSNNAAVTASRAPRPARRRNDGVPYPSTVLEDAQGAGIERAAVVPPPALGVERRVRRPTAQARRWPKPRYIYV